jgi:hypothetical protein
MEHEQQAPVQPQPSGEQEQRFKTLGVRIEEGLHAQLTFIAQLTGSTIGDEIKRSIEERVQAAQSDPELVAKAQAVREQIEREARARQEAIAGMFGATAMASEVEGVSKASGRRSVRGGREGGSTGD